MPEARSVVRSLEKQFAGSVNDNLVDSTDFLPTILEAAGHSVPDRDDLDGISFIVS